MQFQVLGLPDMNFRRIRMLALAALILLSQVAKASSFPGKLVIRDKGGVPCFSLNDQDSGKHLNFQLIEVVSHGEPKGIVWMQYTLAEGPTFEFDGASSCLPYGSTWAKTGGSGNAGQLLPGTPYFVSLRAASPNRGGSGPVDYFGWFCISLAADGHPHVQQIFYDPALNRFRWDMCTPPFSYDVRK
ncbi:hypothetical protein E4L96_19010 [Massilia arenosa]|uniref:Uncharacterized protein n=1 Tax=Zemynaea arenosa TaxID=2561931 RepID=A0A4Y9RYB2_9BURK|nr:hypothetical protein [Massilia arenosa]TFW13863.1 hypothetical protein E4L96_19010 [Massilia arenosa]